VITLVECDVFDKKSEQTFALPLRRRGVAPQGWEVRREGEDAIPLFISEGLAVDFTLPFILLLRIRELA
jgi:hypothetical protein